MVPAPVCTIFESNLPKPELSWLFQIIELLITISPDVFDLIPPPSPLVLFPVMVILLKVPLVEPDKSNTPEVKPD